MSIIHDETQLRAFYDFIARYNGHRMIIPMARNKYMTEKLGSFSFDRFIFDPEHDGVEKFINQCKKYDILLQNQLYFLKDGKTPIKPEWVVFYMTCNSLDPEKAWDDLEIEMIKARRTCVTMLKKGIRQPLLSLPSMYKSALHKSIAIRVTKLDVDTKNQQFIADLHAVFEASAIKPLLTVETKNGYHILLQPGSHQKLYEFITVHKDQVSMESGSPAIAIPGLLQGGFKTRIVEKGLASLVPAPLACCPLDPPHD